MSAEAICDLDQTFQSLISIYLVTLYSRCLIGFTILHHPQNDDFRSSSSFKLKDIVLQQIANIIQCISICYKKSILFYVIRYHFTNILA